MSDDEGKAKRQRTSSPPASKAPKIFLAPGTIRSSKFRCERFTGKILQLAGSLAQKPTDAGVTHVVVGEQLPGRAFQTPAGAHVVREAWLEACIEAGCWLDVDRANSRHFVQQGGMIYTGLSAGQTVSPKKDKPGALDNKKYAAWLGSAWKPEYSERKFRETHLMLLAKYGEPLQENVPYVKVFEKLVKYEGGLFSSTIPSSVQREDMAEYRKALAVARQLAAIRGCAFPLTTEIRAGQLPFVGESGAKKINEITADLAAGGQGTCAHLEAFREGDTVADSNGKERGHTRGAAVRYEFTRLPGVGAATAREWYDAGARSFEDVRAMIDNKDGVYDKPLKISKEAAFSLRHAEDLLAGCSEADVDEMIRIVLGTLGQISGDGQWHMERTGGARRSKASHDADFCLWLESIEMHNEAIVQQLHDRLVKAGRWAPPGEAMCLKQVGRMKAHIESMRSRRAKNSISDDRYDHLLGMYITEGGKVRRLDLIFTIEAELPFCQLGWTGSKQYERFLRQHAVDLGMKLNSHRLMREVTQSEAEPDKGRQKGDVIIVPDEGPPLDMSGNALWPPGWHPGRKVVSEMDIFELLWLPYRAPHERRA